MNLADIDILSVWPMVGGGPLRGKHGQAFWRGGDGYCIALNKAKGTWYDYRDGRGGGTLNLVETALRCDRREALHWLEGKGFIEPRAHTHEQRREYAQRRAVAVTEALNIAHWRSAFTLELNTNKLTAADTGDDETLGCAARLCNVLENGPPENIVREFIRHRTNDPANAARLIMAGQDHEHKARRIAAEVVLLLTRAVESEDLRRAS